MANFPKITPPAVGGAYVVTSIDLNAVTGLPSTAPQPADADRGENINYHANPGDAVYETSAVVATTSWTVADAGADLVPDAVYELTLYSDSLNDIARFLWRTDDATDQAVLTATDSGADTYLHTPTVVVPTSGSLRLSVKAVADPSTLTGGGYNIKLVRMS